MNDLASFITSADQCYKSCWPWLPKISGYEGNFREAGCSVQPLVELHC